MRRDDILQLTRAVPFVPFRVHITSGESYEIKHPDMIVTSLGSICVSVPDPAHPTNDGGGSLRMHSLYHVQTIEVLPPAPPNSGANGVHPKPSNES